MRPMLPHRTALRRPHGPWLVAVVAMVIAPGAAAEPQGDALAAYPSEGSIELVDVFTSERKHHRIDWEKPATRTGWRLLGKSLEYTARRPPQQDAPPNIRLTSKEDWSGEVEILNTDPNRFYLFILLHVQGLALSRTPIIRWGHDELPMELYKKYSASSGDEGYRIAYRIAPSWTPPRDRGDREGAGATFAESCRMGLPLRMILGIAWPAPENSPIAPEDSDLSMVLELPVQCRGD